MKLLGYYIHSWATSELQTPVLTNISISKRASMAGKWTPEIKEIIKLDGAKPGSGMNRFSTEKMRLQVF